MQYVRMLGLLGMVAPALCGASIPGMAWGSMALSHVSAASEEEWGRDITLDAPLVKYLVRTEVPPKITDELRVKRASKFLCVDERGVLWVTHPEMGVEGYIPPICEREDQIKEALKTMGFPNGN